jgi:hypothetical protein
MKKLKLISSLSLALGAILFTGCGGGSGGSSGTTITASDGYVVKLNQPAVAYCGDRTYKVQDVNGNKITFNLEGNDPSKCIFYIPQDAYVDTNNNGRFDDYDVISRMPLSIIGKGVANPLSTAVSVVYFNDLYQIQVNPTAANFWSDGKQYMFNDFDPVKMKKEILTQEYINHRDLFLVLLSDGIADSVKIAEKDGINIETFLNHFQIVGISETLKNNQFYPDPTSDWRDAVYITDSSLRALLTEEYVQSGMNESEVDNEINRLTQELKNIYALNSLIKQRIIDLDQAMKILLAFTDAGMNFTVDENMTVYDTATLLKEIDDKTVYLHQQKPSNMQDITF